jgi:hypothetical protein
MVAGSDTLGRPHRSVQSFCVTMAPELQWGLLACGRSGQTHVELDTSCGPEELLELEISNPNWSLRFRIPGRDIVQELASFLRPDGEESIIIGSFDGIPVEVRRDREYNDRFFIIVGRSGARTEFIVGGQQQVSELSSALLQATEDLK